MDDIDRKIIRNLIEDGHTTNARLAKAVGLSESATLERVRRLESSGVVHGYTALVEPALVDRGLEVLMTFTLRNQSVEDIQRFIDDYKKEFGQEPTYQAAWEAAPEAFRTAVETGVVPDPDAE